MRFTFILVFALTSLLVSAQTPLTKENKQLLRQSEDVIRKFADDIVMAEEAVDRYRADSFFTRGFVKALKTSYSFYYNFDSIKTISKIYAPDSTFKIFTWQLAKDLSSIRQKGAIQMNTADGSLKLIPLFDMSDDTDNPVDSVRTSQRWIGALYYKIILKKFLDKKYYTLLGFDENNERTNRKWMEVITFDKMGNPQFGGRYFQYPNDELKPKQPAFRFCLEYKKDARARMNYDEEMDVIIFDHLVSEEKDPTRKQTLVPDGDFEGFRWVDGRWVYVAKLFDYKVDMKGVDPMLGNAPVPVPIKDGKGKTKDSPNNPYKVDDKKKKKEDPKQKEEY
jgi:hypothetical protein